MATSVERPITRGARADEQSPVRSVARATDILLVLGDGPQSLGRIARRAKLTKPTAHRLLASLGHRQMVMQKSVRARFMSSAPPKWTGW